jgi:hypothetical protein
MPSTSSSAPESSSAPDPLQSQTWPGSGSSDKSSGSRKRKRSIDKDEESNASSSIGWNPEWDEDDEDVKKETHDLPLPSINVSLNKSIVKEEPIGNEHIPSAQTERQDDSSSGSSDGSADDIMHSPLADDTPVRYQMLGAPTLVYRHAPSYRDTSSWSTPMTPDQIEMARYLKDNPLGSWFKGSKRNTADKGETYPQSVHRYLPKKNKSDESDINNSVDQLQNFNRARVQNHMDHMDLPMQYTNSLGKRALLEKERLKWLEWKLFRWDRKSKYRKKMEQFLYDYHMDRDIKRLVYVWERQDEDSVARKERRREKRMAKREAELEKQKNGAGVFTWEPRARAESEVDEKLAGLELPFESPIMDESFSYSSSSSMSDSSTDSIWDSSVSSMETYCTAESDFYRWEEETLMELEEVSPYNDQVIEVKKRELLSSWVFDGDPSRDLSKEGHTSIVGQDRYSSNDLIQSIDTLHDGTQQTIPREPALDPIPHELAEEKSASHFQQVGGASAYGNCLAIVECSCLNCRGGVHDVAQWTTKNLPTHFLVHPTGVTLSCVTISNIRWPRDVSSKFILGGAVIDIHSRILQISICGKSATKSQDVCFVVRTATYCCVLIARPRAVKSNPSGMYECPKAFELSERARIDLNSSRSTMQPSYVPYHVACDPKTSISFFTTPAFAIICLDEERNKTCIQHVTLREEPCIIGHDFSSELADISIIEFDPRDRRVLWAAARPKSMPSVAERFFKRGANRGATVQGLAGYGHSLYRINLRDNSAAFTWSPSHNEYLVDGLYSISGIMPDSIRDHILWISSTSAGKTWALDVRYKSPKVMVSWSLPSLCDDLGAHCSITGVHGAGVLMSQLSSSAAENSLPTIFSVKKDPNTSTLNAYQFPTSMPRFHTRPLESAGFVEVPKSRYSTKSIARSTTFALPDISESIFNVGIALLELPSFTSLSGKNISQLGYTTAPARLVHAFTMTSIGDVYCHTLLACDASEESRAKCFAGLPIGVVAVPVPKPKRKLTEFQDEMITIELSNTFPIPSSAIASTGNRRAFQLLKITEVDDFWDDSEQLEMKNKDDKSQHKHHHDNAFSLQLPCSFHDLGPGQAGKAEFDTLSFSDYKKTASGFGVSEPNDFVSSSPSVSAAVNSVKIPNKYKLIALPRNQDVEPLQSDANAGDLTIDILKSLERKYFEDSTTEEETHQFRVKDDTEYSDEDYGVG